MIESFLLLGLGALLLVKGADLLVGGGTGIALRKGISPLVVGLTVVAFGTSAPELSISLIAAINGSGAISYTNVVGSNIANIALILGMTAIITPIAVNRALMRWEFPFLLAVTAVTCVIGYLGHATRLTGLVLLALYAVYLHHCYRSSGELSPVPEADTGKSLAVLSLMILVGIGGLVIGGDIFVDAAIRIARIIGITEAVIGLTVVALGTSLPELVTSIIASLKGQADISLGNIVGSNIMNILMVLGVTATINPFAIDPDRYLQFVGIPVMMLVTVLLASVYVSDRRLSRAEGFTLFIIYGVTITLAWAIR